MQVLLGALPIMAANSAAPIVGFIDTIVIGRFAGTTALAGIALGAVIYGIFYWGFGFLRMSTSGLSAQADGAGDEHAVQAHLYRALPLGFVIGLVLLALQGLLLPVFLDIYPAEPSVRTSALAYLKARLWGVPATLAMLALIGWFIGLSKPRYALYMAITLSVVNAVLSVLFVAGLDMGERGIGYASAIAEWCGLVLGLYLAAHLIGLRGGVDASAASRRELLNRQALKTLTTANTNILIRTIALNIGFLYFAYTATEQGTVFLAGYYILMQFITLIALVLDSFANVAEARVGAAFGAHDSPAFHRAVRLTSEFSLAFAFLCTLTIFAAGPYFIDYISDDPLVRTSAKTYLPYCAMAPIVGFPAWQLDGIYIGITRTKAMRNAGIAALLIYLGIHWFITPYVGPEGVWIAFLCYYLARALTMLPAWPSIERDLRQRGLSAG